MNPAQQALARLLDARERGQLVEPCTRLGLRLLVAHGSTTQPEPLRPPRDLDLAVELDGTTSIVDVVTALMDLADFDDVDVMDLARAGTVARSEALGGSAIPLHESAPGRFAEAQMVAMRMAFDTAWLRERDLDLLAGR